MNRLPSSILLRIALDARVLDDEPRGRRFQNQLDGWMNVFLFFWVRYFGEPLVSLFFDEASDRRTDCLFVLGFGRHNGNLRAYIFGIVSDGRVARLSPGVPPNY